MAIAWTIAKYKLVGTFNMMRRTRITLIMTSIMFAFMAGMLFFMSCFLLGLVNKGELTKPDATNYLAVILGAFLILSLFGGLRGAGIRASASDRDYIFTAPIKPRHYFTSLQMTSVVSTAIYILPIVIVCSLYLLFARALPLWRVLPLVLVLVILLSLINLVSALATMCLKVLSAGTMKKLKILIYIFIGVVVVAFAVALIPSLSSAGGFSGVTSVVYALPTTFAAQLVVYTFSTAGWGGLAHGGLSSLGGFLGWYIPLLAGSLALSNLYYYEVVKLASTTTQRPTAPRLRPSWQLAPLGKSIRRALLEKELISLWRTRIILVPIRYLFIFLIPLLYRIMPSSIAGQTSIFDWILYSTIIFTLLGITAIVQARFKREGRTMWIQKSLPLRSEQIIDAITAATAIVGVAYATIISLGLSWYFGLSTLFYLMLILATALIGASTGIYTNLMAPPSQEMPTISPNMILASFLSIGLCFPCFIPIGVQVAGSSRLIVLITCIVVLIYAAAVMYFFRHRASRKLDTLEVMFK